MATHQGPFQVRTSFGTPFGGSPPRDVLVLVALLFATYSLQFFRATAAVPALLHLSPAVWQAGWVWQVATYAFAGFGPASLWILLELFIVYWFGRDVFQRLGRRRFWRLLLLAGGGAGALAVAAQLVATAALSHAPAAPFALMQGQRGLLAVLIAAFAMLCGDATVLLFFVLPLRARWLVWVGPLFAFVGFLASHDIGGLVGILAATGLTVLLAGPGGPTRRLRRWWLEVEQRRLQRRLDRVRRKRGFRVVDGAAKRDDEPPRWVH